MSSRRSNPLTVSEKPRSASFALTTKPLSAPIQKSSSAPIQKPSSAPLASASQQVLEVASEADMTHWKNMWSDILSDPDFRSWFTEESKSGYYQLLKNKKIINETPGNKKINKGTFYMKFDKLGHYVTYELKKDSIRIFDSSHSIGGESGLYADCLPDFIDTIKQHFSPKIEFVETFGTPQTTPGDSFCQTWSLSYLLGKPTQTIMKEVNATNKIETLYKLCKKIIGMKVFEEICLTQKDWITLNFKKNKAPKKWTPELFLHFSRKVMDLKSFNFLFV